ncbi:MAG: ATP-dependent helicase HrpB [Gemmatimonadales bacterium]|nr:ATP-dependent helicase HrpB [Gemmatimonadales bacterium]MDZ4390862.1 ATP-dependent helicase HrpB [Gemmatimonadales bacterium]
MPMGRRGGACTPPKSDTTAVGTRTDSPPLASLARTIMMLPITTVIPSLLDALATARRAVLEAPPGAGKTTGVPLALLDAGWLRGQRIVMLEPRRLAARAAAARMASLLGEQIGERVGYRIRGESRVGSATRIEVVTEGILTRMLHHDLSLDGVGLVIFDEFHERSIIADTGLALVLGGSRVLRDELAVLVMSATLDGNAVSTLLGDVPVIRSEGKIHPVTTRFAPPKSGMAMVPHLAAVIREAMTDEPGSVLAFLPGAAEIRRVEQLLVDRPIAPDVDVRPLFGALPPAAQDAAIAPAPAGRRKVVLATNVAETSLTIDGIRIVVDSGMERVPRFSPQSGMSRLETVRITRASADQRRGRAGRTAPGICIRCWSMGEDAGLVPTARPEILSADLTPLVLDLAVAGFTDPAELPWLDPPPSGAVAEGRRLLHQLGALDDSGVITARGRAMAELGAHPRLAHMLLMARDLGPAAAARAALLAALIEERDIFRGEGGPPPADARLRLEALERRGDSVAHPGTTIDRSAVARVREAWERWRQRIGAPRTDQCIAADAGELLAFAYPDRVARRRTDGVRYLLRNGRGVTLPAGDALAAEEWLVVLAVDDAGRDGRIQLAAPLDAAAVAMLIANHGAEADEVEWDEAARRVVARRVTRLGAIVVSSRELARPAANILAAALLGAVRRLGVDALPWRDGAMRFRARIGFVHAHDADWPDVGAAALVERFDEWLGPHIQGMHRWDDLARVDLGGALLGLLSWNQRAALDQLAPERIEVPTGSRIAVDYSDPAAPVLAVRLQECFGMTATPMVMGGKVPVVMHLLSPGYKPVQVTRDLASFWRSGYADVRREMRGRYPRHHWPEDALTATAVRGVPRKK